MRDRSSQLFTRRESIVLRYYNLHDDERDRIAGRCLTGQIIRPEDMLALMKAYRKLLQSRRIIPIPGDQAYA
jgi:hypothetical protein